MSQYPGGPTSEEDLLSSAKAALEDLRQKIDEKKFQLQAFKVSRRLKQLQAQADLVNNASALGQPSTATGITYFNLQPHPSQQPQETAVNLNALSVATNTPLAMVEALLTEYASTHGSIGGYTTNQLIDIVNKGKTGFDEGLPLQDQGVKRILLDSGGENVRKELITAGGGTLKPEEKPLPQPQPQQKARSPPADFGGIRGRLDAAMSNVAEATQTIATEAAAGHAFDPTYVLAQQRKGSAERAVADIKNEITGRSDFTEIMHFLGAAERGIMGFAPNDEAWP